MSNASSNKTLTATLPYGQRGEARISVTRFALPATLDGDPVGDRVHLSAAVSVYVGDRLLDRGHHADVARYDEPWADQRAWDKGGVDHATPITRVGDKALAVGDFGTAINATIESLSQTLLHEVGEITEAEKRSAQAIAEAEAVVIAAEVEGVSQLLSAKDLVAWRAQYNALHNEGGEGYIPARVSREAYQAAKALLTVRSSR